MLLFMWALCPKIILHVMHVNAVKRKETSEYKILRSKKGMEYRDAIK